MFYAVVPASKRNSYSFPFALYPHRSLTGILITGGLVQMEPELYFSAATGELKKDKYWKKIVIFMFKLFALSATPAGATAPTIMFKVKRSFTYAPAKVIEIPQIR